MTTLPKGSQRRTIKSKTKILFLILPWLKCCRLIALKMLQATISLRRVGLQLPTAKPDLDQAYQDRDAENAIGYNTLDTLFVYNPLNLTCVAFFFDF